MAPLTAPARTECSRRAACVALLCIGSVGMVAEARTLRFSGYTWTVRDSPRGNPGGNRWDADNAWVDDRGRLHLRISRERDGWRCAEVVLQDRLGYGTYQFKIVGRPDRLDPNIVLGLFNYTRPGVGPDGTNEIDIEFAKWGSADKPVGNWTVYPGRPGTEPVSHAFPLRLRGDHTTQRFHWNARRVRFQLLHGHQDGDHNEAARWRFAPPASDWLPRTPLPVHMNLWLYQGMPPTDGREVEIVISEFRFTPAR